MVRSALALNVEWDNSRGRNVCATSPLEELKKDNGLPNDFHGAIRSNGDFINPDTGEVIGNIGDYIK